MPASRPWACTSASRAGSGTSSKHSSEGNDRIRINPPAARAWQEGARPRRVRVLREHERGEIDLLGELDEPVESGSPRVERRRPGLDLGDGLEPARDPLEQFGLLARRPEEDARLVHARFMMSDMAHSYAVGRAVAP